MTEPLKPPRKPRKPPARRKAAETNAAAGSLSDAEALSQAEASEEALEKTLETLDALVSERNTATRVRHMPHDIGWLLMTAGVVGLVTPGVLGLPFLAMGGLVLWPGSGKRFEHWLNGQPPRLLKGSMKQIGRFLDDLEQRYPSSPR
ncbi:MAG: hypothetical protein PHT19_10595 [Methylococcus sp.]|nr:hypothetical protein [Methylococcus sp.]